MTGRCVSPEATLVRFAAANHLPLTACQRVNIHYGNESQGVMVSLQRQGSIINVMAGEAMIEVEMGLSGKSLTTLHLSLNRPHYFCHAPVALKRKCGRTRLAVFKDKRKSVAPVRQWLSRKVNVHHLDSLSLSSEKSLFIMPGALVFNILPQRDICSAVDGLLQFLPLLPRESRVPPKGSYEVDGLLLDPQKLPATLRPLVPLIRRWAIGDDVIRSKKLAAASPRARKALSDKVRPLLGAINTYLDAHPHGDESVLLTRLGEAAQS
jgi:hypothetical protein